MAGAIAGASIGAAGAAALYRASGGAEAAQGSGPGFGQALQRAMQGAVDLGRQSDVASTQALTGQGSVTDVVLAVGRAEIALQTSVAVRDRVIGAYQEIMRMPV
ncbi:flagellar hook-basal body complex protein FliE [Humitalea sp. 24SJ18S-53]|uniref:flagellar hook-basal body complex protein FliE n=1 Tax=Humitalea sp. 24SJ18S-53 TaxID=3422307 RepID=UPI003D67F520